MTKPELPIIQPVRYRDMSEVEYRARLLVALESIAASLQNVAAEQPITRASTAHLAEALQALASTELTSKPKDRK